MFEELIGAIILGSKILVVIFFEGGFLIRMQTQEHLIPFFKMVLWMMLIGILFHLVLIHYHIILESVENGNPSYEGFFYLLHLRDFE
jgi:hypothetical protein